MDKEKNALFKEIEKKAEKKTEDMLLCLLKKVRNTFDCNIWMESLAEVEILRHSSLYQCTGFLNLRMIITLQQN